MRRRLRIALGLLVVYTVLHLFVVVRSGQHLERARQWRNEGKAVEAAREYQAAIGYRSPLNPYSDAAIHELESLGRAPVVEDPLLRSDVEDRLRRSLRGTRWLRQSCSDRGAGVGSRDPNPWLFLAAVLALGVGFAFMLRPGVAASRRILLGALSLAAWALLMRIL